MIIARLIYLITIAFTFLSIPTTLSSQGTDPSWSEELRLRQITNIHDSTTWDIPRMLETDNQPRPYGNPGIMNFGAFPAPHYNLLGDGSFKGVGYFTKAFEPILLKNKQIVYASFVVNENPFYPAMNNKDRVFFTVVTVTDTVDLENYSTHRLQISSRNHPDYIGQGYIKSKDNSVDFIAFVTPEGQDYAVVNMRLFDLSYGDIIIIAPQKDGTFRSKQLKGEELSTDTLDKFIQSDLLKRSAIVEFLTNQSVI